jgi:hypothetical protein
MRMTKAGGRHDLLAGVIDARRIWKDRYHVPPGFTTTLQGIGYDAKDFGGEK